MSEKKATSADYLATFGGKLEATRRAGLYISGIFPSYENWMTS